MTEPDFEQLTLWFDPDEKFFSGKGMVTRREWCYDEAARVSKAGRLAEVRFDVLGKVALFTEKGRR